MKSSILRIVVFAFGVLHLVLSAHGQITPYPVTSLMRLPEVQHYGSESHDSLPLNTFYSSEPAYSVGPTYSTGPTYKTGPSPTLSNSSPSWDDDCSTCGPIPQAPCRSPWYGTVNALFMSRDTENAEWFSYYTDNEAIQLMDSRDLVVWGHGFETTIGYCFCEYATEVSYWGIFSETAEASLYDAAGGVALNTTFDINNAVQYNPGGGNQSIVTLFDGAERHRLRRDYELHNLEWNFLGNGGSKCGNYSSSCWGGSFQPLAGLRFVRFSDGFEFHSDTVNTVFNGDPNEVFYAIKTENNLLGFQLGGEGEYRMGSRLRLNAVAKFGAFVNYVDHRSFLGGANGAAVITAGPNTGMNWDVVSETTDLAFAGELDFGLAYQLTSRWSATLGYRVMALSNVALSTNQIPRDFRGIQDVRAVDTNANLILYGGYAGMELVY